MITLGTFYTCQVISSLGVSGFLSAMFSITMVCLPSVAHWLASQGLFGWHCMQGTPFAATGGVTQEWAVEGRCNSQHPGL